MVTVTEIVATPAVVFSVIPPVYVPVGNPPGVDARTVKVAGSDPLAAPTMLSHPPPEEAVAVNVAPAGPAIETVWSAGFEPATT